MAERQFQTVKLPSLGKFYDGKVPNGEIEVYPIRVREEKMMAGATGSGSERMTLLLRNCLKTEIDPRELLLVDRYFLLFYLSLISYGKDRKLQLSCPHDGCGKVFDHEADLEQCEVTYLEDGVSEPYLVQLPVSQDEVGLRFLRGTDEVEMVRLLAALRRSGGRDAKGPKRMTPGEAGLLNMLMPVVTVNGETLSQEDKVAWAEELIGRDAEFMRSAMNQFDFGVDQMIETDCPSCGKAVSVPLPAENLFRFL